jgi:hypothetical protein
LEHGFEDAKFILNTPNRLVAKFIWPLIYKNRKEHCKAHFREVLKMQCVFGSMQCVFRSIQCYVTAALFVHYKTNYC